MKSSHVPANPQSTPLSAPPTTPLAAPSLRANSPLPLAALTPHSLYILLYHRGTPTPSNFHWSFYHHHTALSGGSKFHITGSAARWISAHAETKAITAEFLLVGLVRVAATGEEQQDLVRRVITAEDGHLNETPGMRCRSRLRDGCERLRGVGLMRFESWEALQGECEGFGNEAAEGCERNEQPRPVWESRVCGVQGLVGL
ncbi:hypothetical protein MMC26_003503 [Xylographa opegraphella]|nr:hypothetical protein [Xylographa opegraphella]